MKTTKQIFTMTDEEVKEYLFISQKGKTGFYKWLRNQLHVSEDCNMDCTKICVAKNIQRIWIESAESVDMTSSEYCMALLSYGPKMDESLNDNEISIEDGFIVNKGSESIIKALGIETIHINGEEYMFGPLTIDQMKGIINQRIKDGSDSTYISAVITCHIGDIIDRDFEQFLDFISIEMCGCDLLMDVDYQVLGMHMDCKNTIYMLVSGDVSTIIEGD